MALRPVEIVRYDTSVVIISDGLRDGEVVVTAGVHVNAVGGDCPGKTELHPDILRGAIRTLLESPSYDALVVIAGSSAVAFFRYSIALGKSLFL